MTPSRSGRVQPAIVQSRREEFTYGDRRKPKYPAKEASKSEPKAEPEPEPEALPTLAADTTSDDEDPCGALMTSGAKCKRLATECPYASHKQ